MSPSTSSDTRYIYKIVPYDPKIPLLLENEAGLAVLAPTFVLPSSELDKRDGFVHMSAASQVPGTLKRFFPTSKTSKSRIYLFRVIYPIYQPELEVKWERTNGKTGEPWAEEAFPHFYLPVGNGVNGDKLPVLGGRKGLTEGLVVPQSIAEVVSEEGEEGWDIAVARIKDWLV